jgi:hypothetical protein
MPEGAGPAIAASLEGGDLERLRKLMPKALADKVKAAIIDPVGERPEVSVLFVDMTGFSMVAHTLDSEDLYVLIDQAMRLLVQVSTSTRAPSTSSQATGSWPCLDHPYRARTTQNERLEPRWRCTC